MADILHFVRQQQLVDAHADQLKCEAWEVLQSHPEEWAEAVDLHMQALSKSDKDGIRIVGLLAQVGFAHMLATVFLCDD